MIFAPKVSYLFGVHEKYTGLDNLTNYDSSTPLMMSSAIGHEGKSPR
jgi:hypothetical protein